MKLLVASAVFPYPPFTGTALIAYNYIVQLAKHHEIDLISLTDRPCNDLGDLNSHCNSIQTLYFPKWRSLINKFSCILSDKPWQVAHFDAPQMPIAILNALNRTPYDAVLFFSSLISHCLPEGYVGPSVLNMEDPLALKTQRWAALQTGIKSWFIQNKADRLLRYESKHVPRFRRALLLNRSDVMDYLSLVGGAHLDWIPYAVQEKFLRPNLSERQPGLIVISGNMYHAPNVDAVDFFCNEVFPQVCHHAPDAHLWLVGANPAAAVRKWARNSRITVTGSVPDMLPYLSKAVVSVCPVRLKIGTQTKVLEAMACGTPVVTTTAGNNGIEGISGEHLYVADDPAEMADRIVFLLRGHNWQWLSSSGRNYVEENFTWAKSASKLERILCDVIAEQGPTLDANGATVYEN